MDLEAIKALPVENHVAENAHLYLWVPNALLPEDTEVMKAWGFRYVSNVVWAKRRADGGCDGHGVGFYFRNVTELILFGVRGSIRTLPPTRSQVNMIEARKPEHPRKPDEQYGVHRVLLAGTIPRNVCAQRSAGLARVGQRVGRPRGPWQGAQGLRGRPHQRTRLRWRRCDRLDRRGRGLRLLFPHDTTTQAAR
jgi:hypothetical protein